MPPLLPNRFAVECVREFELAALERFADAEHLAAGGRRTGAVYLYGYVAEMLLKAAYFRLAGFADTDPIGRADLDAAIGTGAGSQARRRGLAGTRNYHDLLSWAELIAAHRTQVGPAYTTPGFGDRLTARVQAVQERWTEVIRYHRNIAYPHELRRVRSGCGWLVGHRGEL